MEAYKGRSNPPASLSIVFAMSRNAAPPSTVMTSLFVAYSLRFLYPTNMTVVAIKARAGLFGPRFSWIFMFSSTAPLARVHLFSEYFMCTYICVHACTLKKSGRVKSTYPKLHPRLWTPALNSAFIGEESPKRAHRHKH